jgi:hypothetical protein
LIVDFCAEVAGVSVCDNLAWILVCSQVAPGKFGER